MTEQRQSDKDERAALVKRLRHAAENFAGSPSIYGLCTEAADALSALPELKPLSEQEPVAWRWQGKYSAPHGAAGIPWEYDTEPPANRGIRHDMVVNVEPLYGHPWVAPVSTSGTMTLKLPLTCTDGVVRDADGLTALVLSARPLNNDTDTTAK